MVTPTQKPVPSNDIKDLLFNSGLLDTWATSVEHEYIDRFGSRHLTAAGMEWIFRKLVEKFNIDAEAAIRAAGYVLIDSFQQGVKLPNNELTLRNHALRDERTGEYYRWNGALPKRVLPGSTPESTGGVSVGAWVGVADGALRGEIKGGSGASMIGTLNGMSVEQRLARAHLFAVDFLPNGYVTDGSISYITQLQRAINVAAEEGKVLVMPPFVSSLRLQDSKCGGLDVISGSHIIFPKGAYLKALPTGSGNYEILGIRDQSDIILEYPRVVGDKYIHTGGDGEWGMGISIRGACNNVVIKNPIANDCWGDGYYIGQTSDTVESTPTGVHLINPIALRNRRQGISVTSAKNLTIDNPVLSFTKSSDSSVLLPAGPHAGIDIEPNSFNSTLDNIVINNLSGQGNDAGLFYIFLGGCEKDAPVNGVYHVDVRVNGLSDKESRNAIMHAGASKNIKYSGSIYINDVISTKPMGNGIRHRSWPADSVPIIVDGITVNDWFSKGGTGAATDTSPIVVYQNTDPDFPAIGGLSVKGLRLNNTLTSEISENILFTSNTSNAGVANVSVELDGFSVARDGTFIQSQGGAIDFKNTRFGEGPLQKRTSSWAQSIGISGDVLIDKPSSQLTMTLPNTTSISDTFIGWKMRIMMKTGSYNNFRLRKGDKPLYVNGNSGSNFLMSQDSGLIMIEYDGNAFYATVNGLYTKEN